MKGANAMPGSKNTSKSAPEKSKQPGHKITESKGRDYQGGDGAGQESQPILDQRGPEIQAYGTLRHLPIALDEQALAESCGLLNQVLADSMILYNLYKKHHWLVAGHTFYQLHLLFDKHAAEQL